MTKQIDPGEGYRLLEPGEVVREGDEFYLSAHWTRVISCVGHTVDSLRACDNEWIPFRRRIEQTSPWIAVSEKPLPESGEALVEYFTGNRAHWADVAMMCGRRHDVVAYQIVAPYVPPKPEDPKRLRYDKVQRVQHFTGNAIKTETWPTGTGPTLVEHRDGDVDPDAALRAREYAERNLGVGHTFAARDILEILNGGNQ